MEEAGSPTGSEIRGNGYTEMLWEVNTQLPMQRQVGIEYDRELKIWCILVKYSTPRCFW